MTEVDASSRAAGPVSAAQVDAWLTELGITTHGRAEREHVTSWDITLDGRQRPAIGITLILDPALALVCWVHYAPPINESFRVSYRMLLRWNDELPFAKFAVSDDERPLLTIELPIADAVAPPTEDQLGLALARIVGIADRLLDDSADWLWFGGKIPDQSDRTPRNLDFLARYEGRLGELDVAGDGDGATGDAAADDATTAGA